MRSRLSRCLLAAALGAAAAAEASPVFQLDPSFGVGGVATYEWPAWMAYQWNAADGWMAPLSNGKFAVLAQLRVGTSQSGQLNWFDPDGSVTPPSPGSGPYTPLGIGGWNAAGLVQSADGSLTVLTSVFIGSADYDFRVNRTHVDGSEGYAGCSGSFGRNYAFDLGGAGAREDFAGALYQDAQGRQVLAGAADAGSGNYRLVATRLSPQCAEEPGFGSNGRSVVDLGAKQVRVHVIQEDQQHRLLIGGGITTGSGSNPDGRCFVARLRENGQLDGDFASGVFSGGGVVKIDNFSNSGGNWRCDVSGLAVDSAGRIYASGVWRTNDNGSTATRDFLIRLKGDGSRDDAFNANALIPYGYANTERSGGGLVLLESDGVAVSAYSETINGATTARPSLAVYRTSDGNYDQAGTVSLGAPSGFDASAAIHRIVPAGPYLFYVVATSGPDYLNHHKVHLLRYRRTSTIPTEPIDRLFANGFQ